MKNIIELLEKQYQSFINQERDWNFFLGLADYVKFMNETTEIRPTLDKIRENKLKEIKIIAKLEKEAIKELTEVKKDILKIIKDEKITKEGLPEALAKLNDYEKGNINPRHYKSFRLDEDLKNLAKVLSENEEDFKKSYPKYGLSKKFIARQTKCWIFAEKRKTELWGALEKLQLVFTIIFRENEYLNKIRDSEEKMKEFNGLRQEMDIIKNDGRDMILSHIPFGEKQRSFSSNDRRIKEFKKDDYILYTTRIHNCLIQGLSGKENKEIRKNDFKECKEIKKITIIKMNNGKYLFAVNDNYKEAKKILDKSEWWQIFIKEVRDRSLPPERKTDLKQIPKELTDYFNYNAEKCPIYFKGKYKLTNVFIGRGADAMLNSDIKTETISEKKYLNRKQKQINSKK